MFAKVVDKARHFPAASSRVELFREGALTGRRSESEEIFQQKNTPYPSQEQVKRETLDQSQKAQKWYCVFSGGDRL